MNTIIEAENRCQNLAWREYDAEFRTRQALKLEPWNKIYSDLWLKLMTNTNKIETQASQIRMGFPGESNQSRPTRGVCFDYNKGRYYFKNCWFSHIWRACKGDHTEKQCPRNIILQNIPMHSKASETRQQSHKGLSVDHSGDGRFELGPTPVELSMFDKQLEEYPNREVTEELKNDFKQRFHIKFEGPQQPVLSKHLPSANMAPEII